MESVANDRFDEPFPTPIRHHPDTRSRHDDWRRRRRPPVGRWRKPWWKRTVSLAESLPHHGGRSSVGRASGCGPECRGFDSRRSPQCKQLGAVTPAPTLRAPVAPLAQRQSNGLLIRRFRVRNPGGAPPHEEGRTVLLVRVRACARSVTFCPVAPERATRMMLSWHRHGRRCTTYQRSPTFSRGSNGGASRCSGGAPAPASWPRSAGPPPCPCWRSLHMWHLPAIEPTPSSPSPPSRPSPQSFGAWWSCAWRRVGPMRTPLALQAEPRWSSVWRRPSLRSALRSPPMASQRRWQPSCCPPLASPDTPSSCAPARARRVAADVAQGTSTDLPTTRRSTWSRSAVATSSKR